MLVVIVAAGCFLAGTILGLWLCSQAHGLRRCPTCRCRSELYSDHLGNRQCGWCWLRTTGQDHQLLGIRFPRR